MAYEHIRPSGGGTGAWRNLYKRLAIIEKYIDLKDKKVIDCGCGPGQYVQAFLLRGADVYGIEYEQETVDKFKEEHPDIADRVMVGDIEAMDFEGESIDLALLNEVLEHVPNEDHALQEIQRILKPNGWLVIFSPNRFYPFELHSVYLKRSNRKLPIYIPFIPYIPLVFGHLLFVYIARNYWPNQLRGLVRKNGFKIIETGYVWQTFENISGNQPGIVRMLKPFLRGIFGILEKIPVVNAFGVSQIVIAQK